MRQDATAGVSALLADDGNPMIIACDSCGWETPDNVWGAPLICCGCNAELFYRPWFEW